jgi:hypothetical protein
MITNFNLGKLAKKKIEVLRNLKSRKEKSPDYRIIDIGGAKEKHFKGKFDFIDAYADRNKVDHKNIKHFNGNLNSESIWEEIKNDAKEHGKYDYCICNHTLEDLRNAPFVANQIGEIAKEGFLSVPSKYQEFTRIGKDRGYAHHNWIFSVNDNKLSAFPKLNLIEAPIFDPLAHNGPLNNKKSELYIFWKNSVSLSVKVDIPEDDLKRTNNTFYVDPPTLKANKKQLIETYKKLLLED